VNSNKNFVFELNGWRMMMPGRLVLLSIFLFTALAVKSADIITPVGMTNSVLAGADASNQYFRLSSYGAGTYTVTTNGSAEWLIVSNATGIFPATIDTNVLLNYSTTNLSSGISTGVLSVVTTDPDPSGNPRTQDVTVVLNVISLFAGPGLTNYVLKGFDATNQTFGVSAGGGWLTYTVATNDNGMGWLNVNSSNGFVTGQATNLVTNVYTTASLDAGAYQGQVTVVGADGGGVTGRVSVLMRVLPVPVISSDTHQLRQLVEQGSNPTNNYIYIWNGNGEPMVGMAYNLTGTNDPGQILQGITPTEGVSTGEHDAIMVAYHNVSAFNAGVYTAIVEIAATNYGGGYNGYWSGSSNIEVVLEIAAPAAPGNVNASKGTYTDKVSLDWSRMVSPVGGAVTYNILRHTSFDPDYAQNLVSGLTVTNYDDTSAMPGVRYYYWVKSVNSKGYAGTNSAYATGYRRLSAPGGLFASDGQYTNKVAVSWADVDGANAYYVYRSDGSSAQVYYTAGAAFEDNNVSDGVVYTYYIQATNAVCASAISVGEQGYVLGRPSSFTASDGGYVGRVVLNWTAVPGAVSYEIWRSTQTLTPPNGGGTKIAEIVATSYSDTSVATGAKYYYWLKSKNSTAISAFSTREEGFAASVAVDLSVSGLTVQPRRIGLGAHPQAVSFRLVNNGGADLSGDNSALRLTFFASTNPVFSEGEASQVGMVDRYVTLAAGASAIVSVSPGTITMPGAAKGYYLFMRLAPVWPSILAPSAEGGWITRRTDAVEASSAGSINYQAMNDYNGDGMSDLTVHGGGLWSSRTYDGYELALNFALGGAGAAVMGDYDGDKKTDPAVYNESQGLWQALFSGSAYNYVSGSFGGPGYVAVPGDYDGSGRTALAVYDADKFLWYAVKVGGGRIMWQLLFGGAGYEPVVGDYDADGIWDLAVYQESSGSWYIRTVSGTLLLAGATWGGLGFRPVPGDYDGDGASDLAVFDRTTGRWYIASVYRGEIIISGALWGASGYLPVAGDFDGDGISDLAVYNPTSGKWFIRTVSGSYLLLDATWGGGGREAVGGVE